MTTRAIFAQAEQIHWVDVAARLRDHNGWEICYFIGGKKQAKRAAALFPGTIFHTKDIARLNRWPRECNAIALPPLDQPLLAALSSYESIYMKMLDRNDTDSRLTYRKRVASYHSQVIHWKGILAHFKPDVVVYRIAPHTGYDYVLYALCRVMGIPTVMFERTSIPGRVYPVASFEERSAAVREAYATELKAPVRPNGRFLPETAAHLEKLSKSFSQGMPYHLQYKLQHYKKSGDLGSYLSIVFRFAAEVAGTARKRRINQTVLAERYHDCRGQLKRKRLRDHYNHLARPVNTREPYIFIALQCEPERQTCPIAGVFGHQFLMIDMLSKRLPDGWQLYVKEHVSQFKDYQPAERSKSIDFYDRIAAMPNVKLVPLSTTSFELIDNAQASATVSGSVGWESVVRGKPSLLFGNSWYRDCHGVFVIHTIEECAHAIRELQNGFQVKRQKLNAFVRTIEAVSVRGYIDRFYAQLGILTPEENVANLAAAIDRFVASP
jgi:hypothetical protein